MDAKFQPSFIPKQPVAVISRRDTGHISLLYVIASILFIITLGLVGGVFIAERSLNQDIVNLNQALIEAKSSFEISTIEELKKVSARTSIANSLLDSHIALSPFFEALQLATYESVSFSALSLDSSGAGAVAANLTGKAESYNSIILQSDFFKGLSIFKSPVFSGFSLDENGSVSFIFSATLDPNLVSYKNFLEK